VPSNRIRKVALALLPLLGLSAVLLLWSLSSRTWSKNLPSP